MTNEQTPTTYVAGFDGTASGRCAVGLALALARHTGARVIAAHVHAVEPAWPLPTAAAEAERDWLDGERRRGEELARRLPDELGAEVPTVVTGASSPAHGLHTVAEDEHAGLIVVGSTEHGPIGRALAGSTARKLLHGAPCPVLVAPHCETPTWSVRRIVVGFDGSSESHEAIRAAGQLAERLGAELQAVAVDVPLNVVAGAPDIAAPNEAWVDDALAETLATASSEVPPGVSVATRVVTGAVGPALAGAASADDLLVVGSRGYGPLRAVLAGTVAGHLVDHAPCPVLVVPRGSGARREPPA